MLTRAGPTLTARQRFEILGYARARRKDFDPNQPRDEDGKWTSGGGGDGGGSAAPSPAPSDGDKPLFVSEQPSQDKIDGWEKQIADRQKELADQGKAGDTEDEQLNRMQTALNAYKQEDQESLDSQKSGLNTIYTLPVDEGDDRRLLAAAFTYVKDNVAMIHHFGAIDAAAQAKAIDQIEKKFGDQVTHLEIKQWNNDTEIIAPFLKAGFKQRGEPYSGMITLVKPTAGAIRISKEHSQKILGASQAAAKLLGYDPKLVDVSDKEHPFKVGKEAQVRYAAGLAYLESGKIEIFPRHVADASGAVSIMAHEVMHQKYQTVLNAVAAERKLVMADPETLAAMKPDGSLAAPLDAKYPLYSRFVVHDEMQGMRIKSDGITEYSRAYWKAAEPGVSDRTVTVPLAQHETLAEMARRLTDTGKLEGAAEWQLYYRDVNQTYDELKAKK
jgi:hypothetical protein